MRELTCIVCPVGCSLTADIVCAGGLQTVNVTGNRCPRGAVYAQEEMTDPKRVVTATCAVSGGGQSVRRIPVKTSAPCPKEKIPFLLKDIYKIKIELPVKTGDVIIENWNGSGINIVAARSV